MRIRSLRSVGSWTLLTAFLLACASVGAAQSQKPGFDPSTANLPIRDIHLMTISEGWLLAGQHILWTYSAGQSWTDITPSKRGTSDRHADHGWILLAGRGCPTPRCTTYALIGTEDGGKSWNVVLKSSVAQGLG